MGTVERMKALLAFLELPVGVGEMAPSVTIALGHLGRSLGKAGEAPWRRSHFSRALEIERKERQELVQKKMVRNDTFLTLASC